TRREEGVAQEVQRVAIPRDPGILRQMAPGAFETHIYPILPYSLKQLELLYAEAVEAEGGWCRWSFPLEAAEVFANPSGELAIEVSLADGAGVGEVLCSWPDAVVTREGDVVRVTLAARGARPEAPFELRWRTGLAA